MDQADKLRTLMQLPKTERNTYFIGITSGKGGVGKSTISANAANLLAQNGYKVVLFDADIGLANLDVILNVKTKKNILDVMNGQCELKDVIVDVKPNLRLIPGESGADIFKFSDRSIFDKFINDAAILDDTDFLIVDTGAGIGSSTQVFLEACDEIVVVTTPDPSAITDAYAVIKLISKKKSDIFLMPNVVKDGAEARRIYEAINKIAMQNLGQGLNLRLLGFIPSDKTISSSIKRRTLFSDDAPHIAPSVELKNALNVLLTKLEQKVLSNDTDGRFSAFFKRLAEKF